MDIRTNWTLLGALTMGCCFGCATETLGDFGLGSDGVQTADTGRTGKTNCKSHKVNKALVATIQREDIWGYKGVEIPSTDWDIVQSLSGGTWFETVPVLTPGGGWIALDSTFNFDSVNPTTQYNYDPYWQNDSLPDLSLLLFEHEDESWLGARVLFFKGDNPSGDPPGVTAWLGLGENTDQSNCECRCGYCESYVYPLPKKLCELGIDCPCDGY